MDGRRREADDVYTFIEITFEMNDADVLIRTYR